MNWICPLHDPTNKYDFTLDNRTQKQKDKASQSLSSSSNHTIAPTQQAENHPKREGGGGGDVKNPLLAQQIIGHHGGTKFPSHEPVYPCHLPCKTCWENREVCDGHRPCAKCTKNSQTDCMYAGRNLIKMSHFIFFQRSCSNI